MRITNGIIRRDALTGLQKNLRRVSSAQQQISSGLRVQRASDDPVAAAGIMQTDNSLRALEQYRRNIGQATARAAAEEGALERLTDVLSRAQELAAGQAGDTASPETRLTVKAEVDQLLEFAVGLGNTRSGEDFLFGDPAAAAPFAMPATDPPVFSASPPRGSHQAEIAAGQVLKTNHNGSEAFLDTGALRSLYDLSKALGSGSGDEVRTALGAVETSHGRVQNLLGDVGARSNQMQVTLTNLDALDNNLRTMRSDLAEIDIEQGVTELVSRQTAFQAAMMATSRVMSLTLADYLR